MENTETAEIIVNKKIHAPISFFVYDKFSDDDSNVFEIPSTNPTYDLRLIGVKVKQHNRRKNLMKIPVGWTYSDNVLFDDKGNKRATSYLDSIYPHMTLHTRFTILENVKVFSKFNHIATQTVVFDSELDAYMYVSGSSTPDKYEDLKHDMFVHAQCWLGNKHINWCDPKAYWGVDFTEATKHRSHEFFHQELV